MKLNELEIEVDGTMKGEGTDSNGKFVINGLIRENQVAFDKNYIGKYHIFYRG
jgi:hypothetical protein